MADSPITLGIFAKAVGNRLSKEEDRIAVEEPLELRLGRTPVAVTMRTPGEDKRIGSGVFIDGGNHTAAFRHRKDDRAGAQLAQRRFHQAASRPAL